MNKVQTKEEKFENIQTVSVKGQHLNGGPEISVYKTDAPLENPEADKFDRYDFSTKIAKAILGRGNSASIVMGLYGSFGTGKTTVLNFIKRELSQNSRCLVMSFNAWQYQNDEQIVRAFFENLSQLFIQAGFENSDGSIGNLLGIYSNLLLPGKYNIDSSIPSSNSKHSKNTQAKTIYEIGPVREKIEQILKNICRKVIIQIDDLDKIDRSQLKTLLRLIKLNANFPYTIFILAFDEVVVARILDEENENKKERGSALKEKLLDTIVQVPIKLPHFSRLKLEKSFIECINEFLSENGITLLLEKYRKFLRTFKHGFALRVKDIRMIKQFRNVLSFTLPMLKGEVDIVDFILLEALRYFYPSVYEAIQSQPSIFQDLESTNTKHSESARKLAQKILDKAFEDLLFEERAAVKYLLVVLFPILRNIFEQDTTVLISQGAGKDEYAAKRNFGLFFNTSDSQSSKAETILENFYNLLEYEDSAIIKSQIEKINKDLGTVEFISSLKARLEAFNESTSTVLIQALGQAGECFSNPDTLFSFSTVFDHPATLIRELLKKIPDKTKRFTIAKQLLNECESVSFAFECYRWMCSLENEMMEDRIFGPLLEQELGRYVSERIAEFSKEGPIYKRAPEESPFLLSVWAYLSGKDTTGEYLKKTFDEDKDNIFLFLKTYLPEDFSSSDLNKDSFLGLDQFNEIGKLIEPEKAFTSLLDSLGEDFLLGDRKAAQIGLIHSSTNVPIETDNDQIGLKFAQMYKSFGFIHSSKSNQKDQEQFRKEGQTDQRRKVSVVKKGIYRPIA
ncbi:MAG: P-loop NTPase fold protein [Bacteroidota bacterium]|nr:P-loop NTPase fold protein [Bacteroidota bacterium]